MKVFIFLFLATNANCLRLQLYNNEDYHVFNKEFNLSPSEEKSCYVVATDAKNRIAAKSIKTDKCVILYSSLFCGIDDVYSLRWRVDKDTPKFDDSDQVMSHNGGYMVGAFSVCSQELGGGPLLDVDFTSDTKSRAKTLASFKKVCGCQNIPNSLTTGDTPIRMLNSYGNGLALFENEHCEPPYTYVPPSTNWIARAYQNGSAIYETTNNFLNAHSFYPMRTVKCAKLQAHVTKFEFTKQTPEDRKFENVSMSLESVLRNDGNAKMTQVYSVSKKVKEVLEMTKAEGFSNVQGVEVGASLEAEPPVKVPLLADLKAKLETSYKWNSEQFSNQSESKSSEKEEEFKINQSIEIPPCTEYHIQSYVKMVSNYAIPYTAFARLTGKAGDTNMRKGELKLNIGKGMEYVRDLDEHAIEVSVKGQMVAKFGIKTFIVGKGELIEGCSTSGHASGPVSKLVMDQPIDKEECEDCELLDTEEW